jgi:hypothetical protein
VSGRLTSDEPRLVVNTGRRVARLPFDLPPPGVARIRFPAGARHRPRDRHR